MKKGSAELVRISKKRHPPASAPKSKDSAPKPSSTLSHEPISHSAVDVGQREASTESAPAQSAGSRQQEKKPSSTPAHGSKKPSPLSYSDAVGGKPPLESFSTADGGQHKSGGGAGSTVAQLAGGKKKRAPTAKDDWKTVGRKPTEKTAEDTEPIINVFKNVKTYFKSSKKIKKFNVGETLGEYCARNIIVHILYGDENGGGHMVLSIDDEAKLPQVLQQKRKLRQRERKNESLFPKDWRGDTIIKNVVDVACDPQIIFEESDRYTFFKVIDNIIIKVVSQNKDGKGIISGYPIYDKSSESAGGIKKLETFLRKYVDIVNSCINDLAGKKPTVSHKETEQEQMKTKLENQIELDKEKPLNNLGRLRGFVENCLQQNDWKQALEKIDQAIGALKAIEGDMLNETAESRRESTKKVLDQVLLKLDEHGEIEKWRQRLNMEKIKDQ